jgi:hypothetical protein
VSYDSIVGRDVESETGSDVCFLLQAVERVLEAEGDDYFVFALSDANLSRYGIKPESLNAVRTLCRLFISSLVILFLSSN